MNLKYLLNGGYKRSDWAPSPPPLPKLVILHYVIQDSAINYCVCIVVVKP